MKMNMKILLGICVIVFCSSVNAREYKSIGVKDRVVYSDIIAVVSIESVDVEYRVGNGLPQLYSVVKVIDLIKSDHRDDVSINFITAGLTPERNPICCELGDRYLIFVARGFPELETNEDLEVEFVMKMTDQFVSAVDGPYSAFRITNGFVEGWGRGRNRNVPLAEVVSSVNKFH